MTHDELLDRIAQEGLKPYGNVMNTNLVLALRAVVELHKPIIDTPDHYTGENEPYCSGCWDAEDEYYALRYFYPCPTIQAIEKELG